MAETTCIAWTDATVNFHIGCTHAGPGCDGCYAEEFARRKFNIKFGPGERRHKTSAGYQNPLRWQRLHDRAQLAGTVPLMTHNHQLVPVPRWVFCNSLSDFFDNEIPEDWRIEAWDVIRKCPSLRWQIVTKRVGNVSKMLPADWDGGRNYPHVGIISTMVNQQEIDRDSIKLVSLKAHGVRWLGVSIEPQLGPIVLGQRFCGQLSWVICGGESKQGTHEARYFDLAWAEALIAECREMGIAFFMKQMGDHPVQNGKRIRGLKDSGRRPDQWAPGFRVQQMPRVYDDEPVAPAHKTIEPDLFNRG